MDAQASTQAHSTRPFRRSKFFLITWMLEIVLWWRWDTPISPSAPSGTKRPRFNSLGVYFCLAETGRVERHVKHGLAKKVGVLPSE